MWEIFPNNLLIKIKGFHTDNYDCFSWMNDDKMLFRDRLLLIGGQETDLRPQTKLNSIRAYKVLVGAD